MKISLCIITRNEEENLRRCLTSAAELVDQIVVLDSGSTDDTEAVAKEFGALWKTREWSGFVDQKNAVLDLAENEWVLSLDGDEALSSTLAEELLSLKKLSPEPESSGFCMPRCVCYEGRWIRHGDWYPDRLVRFFRKSKAHFAGGKVHERLEIEGPILSLKGDIEHYSFRSIKDHEERGEHYAQLWAESAKENGRSASLLDPYTHAAARWLRSYIFRGGFLDGQIGWTIARISTREVFAKYRLLQKLNQST
tara:strand:+ start:7267 stop:8022 length:756 start_codon:yes stop_codon:yes gene_type:complete